MPSSHRKIMINRAPVLTLWAAVVAERLGLDRDEALTMGKALSGLTAHAKGVRLGIYEPTPETVGDQRKALQPGEELHINLMGRSIPAVHTKDGLRVVESGLEVGDQVVVTGVQKIFFPGMPLEAKPLEPAPASPADAVAALSP